MVNRHSWVVEFNGLKSFQTEPSHYAPWHSLFSCCFKKNNISCHWTKNQNFKNEVSPSWVLTIPNYDILHKIAKCYFATKIVLTYCEKKNLAIKKYFWKTRRPRIFKKFEITRTICLNSERSEQFLVTVCFLTCS